MTRQDDLHDPWLIAVWPGMGNVALGAGAYLVQKLDGLVSTEISGQDLVEVDSVVVKDGLVSAGRPNGVIYIWKDPNQKHDLIIYIAASQPATGGYALCRKILDDAVERGVKRVFTFAAMATQLHPGARPRVFAVATHDSVLAPLAALDVELLADGQISGLNGVLLAAAAERGLEGVCLLGEMPFFAINVANPKASAAILEVFARMAGIELDFSQIESQAEAVDERLSQLLERLEREAAQTAQQAEEPSFGEEFDSGDDQPPQRKRKEQTIDTQTQNRIEDLFDKAHQDRSKAVELKQELDRLGLFKEFEDRFLDLFKKGG